MYQILEDRAVILLKGKDALKFIQNFSTNDIDKLGFTYNYLLNNQGRYLFDFFAYKHDSESLYLDCSKEQIASLIKRLSLYKLRSDVVISDESDNLKILYSKEPIDSDERIKYSLPDPRYSKLGYRSLISEDKAQNMQQSGDHDKQLYLNDKYTHTIIDGCIDLVQEKSIPIEFAGEQQHALSFTKGCYVGQEVISRAKHQGVIRKKIYKLDFGTNIALSLRLADITDNAGNKIGVVCSNYKNLAIAQIREEKLLALATKQVTVDGKIASVIEPDWQFDS